MGVIVLVYFVVFFVLVGLLAFVVCSKIMKHDTRK